MIRIFGFSGQGYTPRIPDFPTWKWRLMAISMTHSARLALLPILALLLVCPSACYGQTQAEDLKRQAPAPWRPSFGSINKDAVQSNPGQLPNQAQPNPAPPASQQRQATGPATAQSGAADRVPSVPENAREPAKGSGRTGVQTGGLAKVSKTFDRLPNDDGQVWREYDISPYTSRVTTSQEPQKAVLDWVLRETGSEMWFNEPLGLLHANKNKIFVYHTPEIQAVVKRIVDRFVWTRGQVQNIDINLVTVENPNWRSQSYTMLQPIDVKSPGVEAWMISKENAAILLAQLRKRGDFKQHSGGRLTNHDGQVFSLEKTKPVQFVRSLRWVPNQVPNYQPLMTSLDEGYRLTISSLSAIDNESIEAIIKCDVDQVEKLSTVKVNVPGALGAAEQMNLQIPQMVSWRLHERFRWPNDQVLLLSCGVVATPEPETTRRALRIPGFGELGPKFKRADALLFVDYRGPASEAAVPLTARRNTGGSGIVPIQRSR